MLDQYLGFLIKACLVFNIPYTKKLNKNFTKGQRKLYYWYGIISSIVSVYALFLFVENLIFSKSSLQTIFCFSSLMGLAACFINFWSVKKNASFVDQYFSIWSDILSQSDVLLQECVKKYLKLPKILLVFILRGQIVMLAIYCSPAYFCLLWYGHGELIGLPYLPVACCDHRFIGILQLTVPLFGPFFLLSQGFVLNFMMIIMVSLQTAMLTYLEKQAATKLYYRLDNSEDGRFWLTWLQRHSQCLSLCELIKEFAKFIILVDFLAVLIAISGLGMFCLLEDHNYPLIQRLVFIIMFVPWIILFFWMCNRVELLENKHSNVFKCMYNVRMIERSYLSDQMIIQARCNKPLKFSAMNFFVLSNSMLNEYLKLMYTFLITLINIASQTMSKKNK